VRRHLLGALQLGLGVLQVGRDAGAPEGVIADAARLDSCASGTLPWYTSLTFMLTAAETRAKV